jgi:hypothetical protein
MFKEHQTKISQWARRSPDNFGRVMQFVILTIRMPLHRVAGDFETVEQGGDDAMGVLFGFKYRAWREAWEQREKLFTYLEHVWSDPELTARDKHMDMLEAVADCFGFGPVKAGFVLQLVYGNSGCIDTHNLKRFGIGLRAFSNYSGKKTRKGRRAMLSRYVDTIERQGGPEKLWDGWCEFVAQNSPGPYQGSAYVVSRTHCDALGL